MNDGRRSMDTEQSEQAYILTGRHPRRVQQVAFALGVSIVALERALGANQLMLVRSSTRTADRLLGAKR